jgi:hypothetical protein
VSNLVRRLEVCVRDAELIKDNAGTGLLDSAQVSVWPLRRLKEAGGATPGSSA